jgi:hypothetical protein
VDRHGVLHPLEPAVLAILDLDTLGLDVAELAEGLAVGSGARLDARERLPQLVQLLLQSIGTCARALPLHTQPPPVRLALNDRRVIRDNLVRGRLPRSIGIGKLLADHRAGHRTVVFF